MAGAGTWDEHLAEVGGWHAYVLATVRRVVLGAVPGIVEEWKWVQPTDPRGVPVWSYEGGVHRAPPADPSRAGRPAGAGRRAGRPGRRPGVTGRPAVARQVGPVVRTASPGEKRTLHLLRGQHAIRSIASRISSRPYTPAQAAPGAPRTHGPPSCCRTAASPDAEGPSRSGRIGEVVRTLREVEERGKAQTADLALLVERALVVQAVSVPKASARAISDLAAAEASFLSAQRSQRPAASRGLRRPLPTGDSPPFRGRPYGGEASGCGGAPRTRRQPCRTPLDGPGRCTSPSPEARQPVAGCCASAARSRWPWWAASWCSSAWCCSCSPGRAGSSSSQAWVCSPGSSPGPPGCSLGAAGWHARSGPVSPAADGQSPSPPPTTS